MEYLIQKETLDSIGDAVRSVSEKADPILVSGLADEIRALSSLNFRVLGGTEQPAAPRENDIWVNTGTAIPSWAMSVDAPVNPVDGMVWVETGAFSSVAFNAVKKNQLLVYPLTAYQYLAGSWTKVTAKSYQNGAWQSWWSGQLYDHGEEYPDITGELVAHALDFSGDTSRAPTITKNGDSIVITTSATNYSGGLAYWEKKIDLTGQNVLKFVGSCYDSSQGRAKILVLSGISTSSVVASGVPGTVEGDVEIDISALDGAYYIGFAVSRGSGGNNTMTIKLVDLD